MIFAMGYPAEKSKPSDWHYMRKPIDEKASGAEGWCDVCKGWEK